REDRRSEKRDSEEGEEEGAGDRHCLAYRQASAECLDLGRCTRRGLDDGSPHHIDGRIEPGPDRKAAGTLAYEHLETVDETGAALLGPVREWCGTCAVDEVDHDPRVDERQP